VWQFKSESLNLKLKAVKKFLKLLARSFQWQKSSEEQYMQAADIQT